MLSWFLHLCANATDTKKSQNTDALNYLEMLIYEKFTAS